MVESIIFDLDGTLWDSVEAVCAAWKITLKKHPDINVTITRRDVMGYMGLPMDKICERLFPMMTKEEQRDILEESCRDEENYLYEYGGNLYPNLENTLKVLSKKYKLFIVSNCQDGYIQCFMKVHHLQKYFTDFECWGKTKLSKGENNKLIMKRNNIKSAVYVGDTQADAEAAIEADIQFVFASYGFGLVKKYDYVIKEIADLLNIDFDRVN